MLGLTWLDWRLIWPVGQGALAVAPSLVALQPEGHEAALNRLNIPLQERMEQALGQGPWDLGTHAKWWSELGPQGVYRWLMYPANWTDGTPYFAKIGLSRDPSLKRWAKYLSAVAAGGAEPVDPTADSYLGFLARQTLEQGGAAFVSRLLSCRLYAVAVGDRAVDIDWTLAGDGANLDAVEAICHLELLVNQPINGVTPYPLGHVPALVGRTEIEHVRSWAGTDVVRLYPVDPRKRLGLSIHPAPRP